MPWNPTVYAQLLDRGLREPIPEWNAAIAGQVRGLADGLTECGIDAMRKAYVAGVADGFGQGVAAGADSGGLVVALEALHKIAGCPTESPFGIAANAIVEIERLQVPGAASKASGHAHA